jgi:hypothetical protein
MQFMDVKSVGDDFTGRTTTIRHTFLEDIWGGARRGLLRSSSLSQEGGVVQLVLCVT